MVCNVVSEFDEWAMHTARKIKNGKEVLAEIMILQWSSSEMKTRDLVCKVLAIANQIVCPGDVIQKAAEPNKYNLILMDALSGMYAQVCMLLAPQSMTQQGPCAPSDGLRRTTEDNYIQPLTVVSSGSR
jgi:hypothetical protein